MQSDQDGNIRHALRNQLNTISVNAELIKLLVQSGDANPQVLSSADKILQECKNCSSLLDDAFSPSKS